jgi:hypothetical protein
MNITLIKDSNSIYYELEIKHGKCKISHESLPKILDIQIQDFGWNFKPNWFVHSSGYVICTIPSASNNKSGQNLYMHRYLMNEFSNDKQKTIDHKNQDKTDNRLENLHLVTQSFQNHYRHRKERKEIEIPGFDNLIKLPEYISYIKEPTIKDTSKKTSLNNLPAHFLVESKIFNFSKHASKSSKISIKERLADAIIIRYNLIIDNSPDITILYIDSYKFSDIKEFENHSINLIKDLCNITLTKIPQLNINYKKNTKLPKSTSSHNISAIDSILDNQNIDTNTDIKKDIKTFENNDMNCLKDDQNDTDNSIKNNVLYNYLEEIVDARINKKNRSVKNNLDLYIIHKLNIDINKLNKSITAKILNVSDDFVGRVLKNEINLRYTEKITDEFINSQQFITEYAKIKNEIISMMNINSINQLSGLKNINLEKKINRDWKVDVNTIIEMIKDKTKLTYNEIAEKYTDIDGNPISTSDVQNICSNGRSYWLDKDDFINRSDITFEEYKSKRNENSRHITPKKYIKDMNLTDENIRENAIKKHQDLCKKNAISKRTCQSNTLIDIFLDKYTILTALKTSMKYTNKKGETVSEALVKQIWSGSTSLFKDDFIGRTDITYDQYLNDIKKEKSEFSRPLEYQQKYQDIINGINNKEIKALNRTHIKTLKMVGKDDKFISELRQTF